VGKTKRIVSALTGALLAAGLMTMTASPALADRPCTGRSQKLHFMGEKDVNFGGGGIVTLLNCHATKRNASIDVSRGFDPDCQKIPFGETRKFEYNRLKGIAEYNKPKWC
jgi:hypothetical protein